MTDRDAMIPLDVLTHLAYSQVFFDAMRRGAGRDPTRREYDREARRGPLWGSDVRKMLREAALSTTSAREAEQRYNTGLAVANGIVIAAIDYAENPARRAATDDEMRGKESDDTEAE